MEHINSVKKPNLILTSDWHLREDTPTCWTGDFQKEQWEAVEYVKGIQLQWKCPVIHAGDLFHHWKPSPWLLCMTMKYLPYDFYTIYGQHDLPQHNWKLRERSGIAVLEEAKRLIVLPNANYGQEPDEYCKYYFDRKHVILVWHHMTYINPPFPGAKNGQAIDVLKKYPQYDLIVTGDNHQSFSAKYQNRLLVNTGSLTRQKADQIDFQPRVALWYAETNSIDWVNIPIQNEVITREHIDKQDKKQKRIEAFVSSLDVDWEREESFEKNLEIFKSKNRIRKSVLDIINKAVDN